MTGQSGIPPKLRAEVVIRDEGHCVRCGELISGYDYSIQHRVARGMGGSRHAALPSALVLLCGSAMTGCHGWVEANPAVAREQGYRVPPGLHPATWPLLWHGQGHRDLTDEGWAPVSGQGEAISTAGAYSFDTAGGTTP